MTISLIPPMLTVLQDRQVTTAELDWYVQEALAIAIMGVMTSVMMSMFKTTSKKVTSLTSTEERYQPQAEGSLRQIRWSGFESLPSYPLIEQAVKFPFDPSKKCSPVTRDGYVSVAAIYNMSRWARWKEGSLGGEERAIASAIGGIPLYKLMELNEGRRINQPALFPARILGPMPHTTPGTKREIRDLLEFHTTVESWGTPCITRLASLMGRPIPATRDEKARLISRAKAYVED